MSAAKVLIIVSGKSKAPIVKEILTGPITPKVPATALLLHRDCIMIVDRDAYSEMEKIWISDIKGERVDEVAINHRGR